ncbi:hypothetical protein [Pseudomonas chlororaphis]|uniref:hypothetical protein n=1 Tax=Pseudomonas chlororaphis TaxID=587753 RepID=UPI00358DAA70
MYRRILLTAFLGLALSACVPYYDYDGGSTYYRSEVYTTPAPVYYGGLLLFFTAAAITRRVIINLRLATTNLRPGTTSRGITNRHRVTTSRARAVLPRLPEPWLGMAHPPGLENDYRHDGPPRP